MQASAPLGIQILLFPGTIIYPILNYTGIGTRSYKQANYAAVKTKLTAVLRPTAPPTLVMKGFVLNGCLNGKQVNT